MQELLILKKMAKCLLCNSGEQNDVAYGELLRKDQIVVHEFCLYLSSGLVQTGDDDDGLLGFLPENIKQESNRVQKLYCCFCHKNYANIGCCKSKCRHAFHLICGLKNGAVNEFVGSFRSFCNYHVPKLRRQRPPTNEICCICYDTLRLDNRRNYCVNMIKAPCCSNGWFHKNCLQGFARSAGYFFKCPLCNDTDKFRERMPYLGIFIQNRDAAWELEPNAFAELLQRPNKCDAEKCQHKNGREDVGDKRNPLLFCETCGSVAMHKLCLPKRTSDFHCAECLKIIESTTASEGDSGRESLQAGDDDDEDIDVCYISETEDEKPNLSSITDQVSFKKNHISIISENSDDENEENQKNQCSLNAKFHKDYSSSGENSNVLRFVNNMKIAVETSSDDDIVKPVAAKTKKQRLLSESSNDEETSGKSTHFPESSYASEFTKLNITKPVAAKTKKQRLLSDSSNDEGTSVKSKHFPESSDDSESTKLDITKPVAAKAKKHRVLSDSSNDEGTSVKSKHFPESSDDSECTELDIVKPVAAKTKKQRLLSESSNDEETSVKSRHFPESSDDSESTKLDITKPVAAKANKQRVLSDSSNDKGTSVKSKHLPESSDDSESTKLDIVKPVAGKTKKQRLLSESSNDEETSGKSRHFPESSDDSKSTKLDIVKPVAAKAKKQRVLSDSSNDEETSVKSTHFPESSDDSESTKLDIVKPVAAKAKKQRVLSDSSNDEETSVKSTHFPESSDDSESTKLDIVKPVAAKAKKQRVLSDSSNDEETSVKSRHFPESSDDIESIKLDKLSRKRKIIDDLEDKNKCCSPIRKIYANVDSDEDPLDFLDKLIEKKRKIQDYDDSKNKSNRIRVDSPHISSISASNTYIRHEQQRNSDTKSIIQSNEYIIRNTLIKTENTANKENNRNSSDTDFFSTDESNKINNPLDISCIANRTRRRRTIKSNSTHTSGRQVNSERTKSRYSECSTDIKKRKKTNPSDVSCIAKRTRRKTCYNSENTLATIGEESSSESSESYRGFRDRLSNANVSKDNGFSSDLSSKDNTPSFSPMYSTPGNSFQSSRKKRLRVISLTSEEELGKNDAMKNR